MKSLLDASVTFRDTEILGRITMADQVRVLESLGWHRKFPGVSLAREVWTKEFDHTPWEFLVAGDELSDRLSWIGELVHSLARAEKIPVLRVVLMLAPGLEIDGDRIK